LVTSGYFDEVGKPDRTGELSYCYVRRGIGGGTTLVWVGGKAPSTIVEGRNQDQVLGKNFWAREGLLGGSEGDGNSKLMGGARYKDNRLASRGQERGRLWSGTKPGGCNGVAVGGCWVGWGSGLTSRGGSFCPLANGSGIH